LALICLKSINEGFVSTNELAETGSLGNRTAPLDRCQSYPGKRITPVGRPNGGELCAWLTALPIQKKDCLIIKAVPQKPSRYY